MRKSEPPPVGCLETKRVDPAAQCITRLFSHVLSESDTFDPVLGHAVLIDSLLLNRHGAPCLEHLVVIGGTRDVRVTRYSKAQFGKFVLQHFRDRLDLLDAFGVDLIRIKIKMNF